MPFRVNQAPPTIKTPSLSLSENNQSSRSDLLQPLLFLRLSFFLYSQVRTRSSILHFHLSISIHSTESAIPNNKIILKKSKKTMNSNFGKNFDFDLGLGSSRTTSLNDQKNKNSSYSSYSSYSSSSSSAQSKPAWQPNKPSWTHQPAPAAASQPTSMVGDILGKSWSSSAPSSGIGIVDKNPNLFGDLVNSSLGQEGKANNNANVPLKNSTPATTNKSPFSMGSMAGSLPKTNTNPPPPKSNTNWGGSSGSYTANVNTNSFRGPNLGGPSMKSINGNSGGGKIGSGSRDPFGSLVDFSLNSSNNLNFNNKVNSNSQGNDVFGDFLNAPKTSTTTSTFPNSSGLNIEDFLKPTNQDPLPHPQSSSDPLDMFFPVSTTATDTSGNNGLGGLQQSQSEMGDWGAGMDFGGDDGGPTTELDGLPPPPAGVNASAAKNKGMDNYKQGQYADAIKWLSWAVVLLEKVGDNGEVFTEVLSSRASCYKEVGEYKKAVADCTKVLEHDEANVTVLVQRALLYESMEKYKLGAEDLKSVLKIDPGNRIARSTIHRLTKLAD